jgi:hypothetical protein
LIRNRGRSWTRVDQGGNRIPRVRRRPRDRDGSENEGLSDADATYRALFGTVLKKESTRAAAGLPWSLVDARGLRRAIASVVSATFAGLLGISSLRRISPSVDVASEVQRSIQNQSAL